MKLPTSVRLPWKLLTYNWGWGPKALLRPRKLSLLNFRIILSKILWILLSFQFQCISHFVVFSAVIYVRCTVLYYGQFSEMAKFHRKKPNWRAPAKNMVANVRQTKLLFYEYLEVRYSNFLKVTLISILISYTILLFHQNRSVRVDL